MNESIAKLLEDLLKKNLVDSTNRIYNLTWSIQKELRNSEMTEKEYDSVMTLVADIQIIIEGFSDS